MPYKYSVYAGRLHGMVQMIGMGVGIIMIHTVLNDQDLQITYMKVNYSPE